jgi:hypothetical protein
MSPEKMALLFALICFITIVSEFSLATRKGEGADPAGKQ